LRHLITGAFAGFAQKPYHEHRGNFQGSGFMSSLDDLFNALTGGGINRKNPQGETPLLRAVRAGSPNDVKKLLKSGADPNVRDKNGLSPLHIAAYWGETAIVEMLLSAKADPASDNGQGWTPLHSAALSGGVKARGKIIDLLKKAGARDDAPDAQGWTAADYMMIWAENAAAAAKLKDFISLNGPLPQEAQKIKKSADKPPKKRPVSKKIKKNPPKAFSLNRTI
jgi:ankyrin repeat protein